MSRRTRLRSLVGFYEALISLLVSGETEHVRRILEDRLEDARHKLMETFKKKTTKGGVPKIASGR